MKKPNSVLTAFFAILILALSACKKDNPDNNNSTVPTNYASPSALLDKYAPKAQKFSIDAGITASLTLQQFTYFNFTPGIFVDENGKPVTGKIDLEIIEVYKKSDMIFSHISTSTYPDSLLLESGGMYYLSAKQNGKEVQPAPDAQYTVRLSAMKTKNDMLLFDGSGRNADFFNIVWRRSAAADTVRNRLRVTPEGYLLNTNKYHWINCDRFAQANPITSVKLKLAGNGPAYDSTTALLVFDDNSVINLYREENNTNAMKVSNMPVGFNATAVIITMDKGKIYSAFKPITITNNFETEVSVKETTEEDLIKAIKALD